MTFDFALRLFTAFACGVAIGIERQMRQRTAGLRTITLVASGACLFVTLGVLTGNGVAGVTQPAGDGGPLLRGRLPGVLQRVRHCRRAGRRGTILPCGVHEVRRRRHLQASGAVACHGLLAHQPGVVADPCVPAGRGGEPLRGRLLDHVPPLECRAGLLIQLANLPEHPESVPINMLVKVKGTPLAEEQDVDPFDFIRMLAVARIMMPKSHVRLSAGRE